MKIDITIERTRVPEVDFAMMDKIDTIKNDILALYRTAQAPVDFREVIDAIKPRASSYLITEGNHRYIFEEVDLQLSQCTHEGRMAPWVQLRYAGLPFAIRNRSFFDAAPYEDADD